MPVREIEEPSSINSGAGGFGASVATDSVGAVTAVGGFIGSGAAVGVGAGAQFVDSQAHKEHNSGSKLLDLVFITHLLSVLQKWDNSFYFLFDIMSIVLLLCLN